MQSRTLLVCIILAQVHALLVEQAPAADGPRDKRVLIVGIDGCRPDAIEAAVEATHLHALVREGLFAPKSDVLGDRNTGADTSTGPGWSSILTGVWADKHQVRNNLFAKHDFKTYPTFFHRFKHATPDAEVHVINTWTPFERSLFAGLDSHFVADGDKVGYGTADEKMTVEAVKILTEKNPRAMFTYFGEVDATGHGYGFHPKSPKYTKALEVVDSQIGRILKAMRGRATYDMEDWLIIVCTDHGGRGREHGLGEKVPESRTGFIILNGRSVKPGVIKERVFNTDIAAIALTHLGVPIKKEWDLDGQIIEAKK